MPSMPAYVVVDAQRRVLAASAKGRLVDAIASDEAQQALARVIESRAAEAIALPGQQRPLLCSPVLDAAGTLEYIIVTTEGANEAVEARVKAQLARQAQLESEERY